MARPTLLATAALLLAGCLSPAPAPAPPHPTSTAVLDESLPPEPMVFEVPTLAGGTTRVAALAWAPPEGARTVLLALHGSGGSKADWGPLPTGPGYSFAHAQVAGGRAVVAIDFPGYADSPPLAEPQTMEALAFVADGVARQLRERYPVVVGHGLSMGALVAQIAQALHESFDGLASTGWSHGGFSESYLACLYRGEQCPDPPYAEVWHLPRVAPEVVAHLEATRPNRLSPEGRASIHLWGGCVFAEHAPARGECVPWPEDAPRPGAIAAHIRVPVLLMFGENDFVWDMARVPEEPLRFTNAPAVALEVVPATGHFVRWHASNADADARLARWLEANRF